MGKDICIVHTEDPISQPFGCRIVVSIIVLMAFRSVQELLDVMMARGAEKVLIKELSENDNSKNQIYLGGSFRALNQIPFGEIRTDSTARTTNFKAPIDLSWINDDGMMARAPAAQLILYPDYPEVRLSGFLRGCLTAPSSLMQPIQRAERTGGTDGRVLILGVNPAGPVIAYLGAPGSSIAEELASGVVRLSDQEGVFRTVMITGDEDPADQLLRLLRHRLVAGWCRGCRLDSRGKMIPYAGQNVGGYTLEAMLGIVPNAISGPDMLGWELKAHSGDRITLMTPEPNGGIYRDPGIASFMESYGHHSDERTMYFTGQHKTGLVNGRTGLTMEVRGYDHSLGRIIEPDLGIVLVDASRRVAAVWSYSRLLEHWGRKHDRAAYFRYESRTESGTKLLRYDRNVWLGRGTDFTLFIAALANRVIVYDPGTRMRIDETGKSTVKKRNQFRVGFGSLESLYYSFEQHQV